MQLTRMFACAAILLFSQAAIAQTVNIESLAKDKDGFALQLAGSLNISSGNVDQTTASGGVHTQYLTLYDDADPEDEIPPFMRQRLMLLGNASYDSESDERIVNNRFSHLRWTAMWLKRLGSEVFAQYQFSEFSRLQFRLLGGVGARVVLLHLEDFSVHAGTAYMLEFEQLTTLEGEPKPDDTIAHRWSSLLSASAALFDGALRITNTVYIQPRFADFSDYRFLDELSVDVAVTKVLSLGSAFSVAHDSDPPATVEATDLAYAQTIKLTF